MLGAEEEPSLETFKDLRDLFLWVYVTNDLGLFLRAKGWWAGLLVLASILSLLRIQVQLSPGPRPHFPFIRNEQRSPNH